MTAYLRQHKARRRPNETGGGQYRPGRRLDRSPTGRMTGLTVLHTSEGAMDTVGVDTGTANLASFIQRRTDAAGSYHHAADSDDYLLIVDLDDEAYQDGTGSNPWATSISFVCRTTDWARMSPERRAGFLHQGALAFKAQQDWRQARGYPLTELRLLTANESDRGESGFVYHGDRDEGRRSDPGTTNAAPFPIDQWLDACRAVMTPAPTPKEDDMAGFGFETEKRAEDMDGAIEDTHKWMGHLYRVLMQQGVLARIDTGLISVKGAVGRIDGAVPVVRSDVATLLREDPDVEIPDEQLDALAARITDLVVGRLVPELEDEAAAPQSEAEVPA